MYRKWLCLFAGVLAAGAFALTPTTAMARGPRGGGGGAHMSGGGRGWSGGGRGWSGGGRGWGWGGFGAGVGVGLALDRGWGWGGYGGYGPGYSSYGYSPYYYGDTGTFYNTTPYYGGMTYDSGTPLYNDTGNSGYAYGNSAQNNQAHIRVVVPQDAKVWFDNRMTQQTGTERSFESPALTPGKEFSYDVKAQWTDQDGKTVTRTKHVDVQANDSVTVNFMREANNQ